MDVEFDPQKAVANFRKHRVGFEEAATCFFDQLALSMEDPFSQDENRWILIGMSVKARYLTVVYTIRNKQLRIISARKATKREVKNYAQRV